MVKTVDDGREGVRLTDALAVETQDARGGVLPRFTLSSPLPSPPHTQPRLAGARSERTGGGLKTSARTLPVRAKFIVFRGVRGMGVRVRKPTSTPEIGFNIHDQSRKKHDSETHAHGAGGPSARRRLRRRTSTCPSPPERTRMRARRRLRLRTCGRPLKRPRRAT